MTNVPAQRNDAARALASTARLARFQVYDSFGNHVAESTAGAGLRGSFAWRGQEGSATDAGTTLVYMQNRHYDPELGRQACVCATNRTRNLDLARSHK